MRTPHLWNALKDTDLIVIDAQYFTKKDIESLHQNGTKVYTYLNIGSVENFREYYKTYEKFTIGKYEHWDEEKWVDVSVPAWQKFIEQLSKKLFEKGVDGFFIDNCDVYYYAPRKSIFEGSYSDFAKHYDIKKSGHHQWWGYICDRI